MNTLQLERRLSRLEETVGVKTTRTSIKEARLSLYDKMDSYSAATRQVPNRGPQGYGKEDLSLEDEDVLNDVQKFLWKKGMPSLITKVNGERIIRVPITNDGNVIQSRIQKYIDKFTELTDLDIWVKIKMQNYYYDVYFLST